MTGMCFRQMSLLSPKNVEPRQFGQHHIQQNKVGIVLASTSEAFVAVPAWITPYPALKSARSIRNPLELAVFDQKYLHVIYQSGYLPGLSPLLHDSAGSSEWT